MSTDVAAYDPVFIRKVYRDPVRSMLWGAYLVNTDTSGSWLFTPSGSRYLSEQSGQALSDSIRHVNTLHLSPRRQWWFARWDDEAVLYVDIARPTEVHGQEWRYEDLYLDLYKPGPTALAVDDQEEFEAAWSDGLVTSTERFEALAAKDAGVESIKAAEPPFDDRSWQRLEDLIALSLPPVILLPPPL